MSQKNIILMVVIAIVFAGGGFFGGMKYAQAKRQSQAGALRNGAVAGANGGFAGRRGGQAGGATGGFASGQIISQDDKSITIKMMDGSSKIVFLSASTQIAKSYQGAVSDLTKDQQVVVTGTSNSDGSLTASSIQIRPVMIPPPTK